MEKQIAMRDGIKLFTSIYIPNDSSEKHPILLRRTPYSCAPCGEGKFAEWWLSPSLEYFKLNYIIVKQDVRGKFMSEGNFKDIRPFIKEKKSNTDIDESTDAYDAMDWMVKNIPNNNGNVGVFGISYPGFYATEAALCNHPAFKAVSPQVPVTDWFIGDDDRHKGVPFMMDNFLFDREFSVPRAKPATESAKRPDIVSDDNYKYFIDEGTFYEIKKKYFADSIKIWNDLAAHPDYVIHGGKHAMHAEHVTIFSLQC